jgi:membrane-associated phospholipid phosphatase
MTLSAAPTRRVATADASRPWRILVTADAWAIPLIACVAAAALVATDSNVTTFLALNAWSTATGPAPWPYVTVLGDTAVAIVLFLPFAWRRPDLLWALVVAAVLSTLFVHGLKPWIEAPRPPAVLAAESLTVIGPAWRAQSFPSGHTTTAFTAAALVWMHVRHPAVRSAVLALALAAGLSRAVVGVHWPLDIAAGAFGGWCAGAAGTAIARRWPVGTGPRAHAAIALTGAAVAVALLVGLKTGYPTTRVFTTAIALVALAWSAWNFANRPRTEAPPA